jgi:23S rRNA (pseudouridine1915-N3)-methyltransferase
MMRIVLLVTGRTDTGYWNDALNDYTERLKRYITFEIDVIRDLKKEKNRSEAQQKALEGRLILKSLQAGDECVLLDERGKELTSKQFALYLDAKIQSAPKRLVFVIGGAYGFSDEVFERASERISLSKMTFSHQMVRSVFVEQLYRAMTILRGEPYHHD